MIIQKPTPNFSVGRGGFKPEIIVLHIMVDKVNGSISETDNWFLHSSGDKAVSAHYGISSIGDVHQYVKDEDTAWAQGKVENPSFKLYKPNISPNLYCLSIEHEGIDLSKATEIEINTSVNLIRSLAAKWNIPIDRDHIIGHYQIRSSKPNCPATDKSIIDRIIKQAQGMTEEQVPILIPRSKILKITNYLLNL